MTVVTIFDLSSGESGTTCNLQTCTQGSLALSHRRGGTDPLATERLSIITDAHHRVHPNNLAEFVEAERINKRMTSRALRMKGTCTGEHGIGLKRLPFLRKSAVPQSKGC